MTTTKRRGQAKQAGRTSAEWVTFAISCLVLLVVAALIAAQLVASDDPPAPVANLPGEVREAGGRFYVPVEVVNEGDETAAEVQVTAALTIDGEVTEGDQTIDFLSGGESEDLEFVFDDDPADGDLEVRVSGYAIP